MHSNFKSSLIEAVEMRQPPRTLIFALFLVIVFIGNSNMMGNNRSPKTFFYRTHLPKSSDMKSDDDMKKLLDSIIKHLIKKAVAEFSEKKMIKMWTYTEIMKLLRRAMIG